jgi:hypothetical protein
MASALVLVCLRCKHDQHFMSGYSALDCSYWCPECRARLGGK